jgi:hypothetical protein
MRSNSHHPFFRSLLENPFHRKLTPTDKTLKLARCCKQAWVLKKSVKQNIVSAASRPLLSFFFFRFD